MLHAHLPVEELRTQVQSSRRFWLHAPHMLRMTLIVCPGWVNGGAASEAAREPDRRSPRYKAVFQDVKRHRTGTNAGSLVMTPLLFVH